MDTYTIRQHADGYEVREQNASHGISTHANILDALNTCRVANTWSQRAARAAPHFNMDRLTVLYCDGGRGHV
jgi:hypothetical protein